ncbi:MAG: thiamine pyrophosphate-dependent enzyme [Dehalococcoidales bacterium]
MAEMTGAEVLVNSLVQKGADVIFGIPGIQIMELVDTVSRTEEIRWISPRHEQTTAYMAFGYSRTTGKTGVAMVVPGPGALNASAAIGTAYAASTPLLLIAGQINRNGLYKNRGVLHEVTEQLDVFRPITKFCHRAMKTEELPELLEKAFFETESGRPRPVEIEIPWDLWKEKADIELKTEKREPAQTLDVKQIMQAAGLLANAHHPVIWAGGGVITSDASTELTSLAEKIKAPVVMTPEGKGAISGNNILDGGVANFASNPILREADVLLCVGSRFVMGPMSSGVPSGTKVIQIDADTEELGRNHKPEIGIIADAREALSSILDELKESGNSLWDGNAINAIKDKIRSKQREVIPIQMDIIQDIRDALPGESILIPGVTNLGYWLPALYPVLKPRTFLTSSYFGTLGYAFPTALGAKIGNPDKPVVAVCGDGGFLFASGELATAVQEGINVIVIVFVDNAYGACLSFQRRDYDNRAEGTRLKNPDFAALANSYGAKGVKLAHHSELKAALQAALNENTPVLIEVPQPDLPFPWEVSLAV